MTACRAQPSLPSVATISTSVFLLAHILVHFLSFPPPITFVHCGGASHPDHEARAALRCLLLPGGYLYFLRFICFCLMCMGALPLFICAQCVGVVPEEDRREHRTVVTDAVSHHVGARHQTQVLCKSSQRFSLLSHRSRPLFS